MSNTTGFGRGARVRDFRLASSPAVDGSLNRGTQTARGTLSWRGGEFTAQEFPVHLYRFLKKSIPVVSGCIWTWSRLSAAPADFLLEGSNSAVDSAPQRTLDGLADRLFPFSFRRNAGLSGLLPFIFDSYFTDGAFAGFVEISADGSRIERFVPVDVSGIVSRTSETGEVTLALQTADGLLSLDRPDFYYFGLNTDQRSGLGRSILSAVPFVSYVERQLVEDMRRASHNSGFHRLHVKVAPPERQAGETDTDYTNRANGYFDSAAAMIRQADVDDNPVTWDDIAIEYIGPKRAKGDADGWFVSHRAMIEEICAGTNLAPFLLGYSFGATETWSAFKYDLVMRQVGAVQREAARFLAWLGNIELALSGSREKCRLVFDNNLSHQLVDTAKSQSTQVDLLVRLFQAGLLDESEARQRARDLIR